MNEKPQTNEEPKIMGVPNRQLLYSRASKYAPKAIKRLAEQLDSKNESVVLGAAKTLLAKVIPDLKSNELVGKDGEPIAINLIRDYLSTYRGTNAPSAGSSQGQDALQNPSVAPPSKKDINSNRESGAGSAQPVP